MRQSRNEALALGLGDALIVIDVQVDFLPNGALPVPGGDCVIEPLNRYIAAFSQRGLAVIAVRDWHPAGHCSFREQGGPWPVHCIAGSAGAAFPATLSLPVEVTVIDKAVHPDYEDFSGFASKALPDCLEHSGIDRIFAGGLATEYCVLETVLDSVARGYAVVVLEDAIAGLESPSGSGERALRRMRDAGARVATLDQLGL